MKAYIFPGQGAQFPGMGKHLFENSKTAYDLFNIANEILGFRISDIMFDGSAEDLKQTSVTQPAIFLHSVILALSNEDGILPEMVAGHSLGEFSALVVNKSISFEDGLKLVSIRANAMQKACENNPGTMAAVLGLEDNIVEKICGEINGTVVAANYNCPGQLVISGELNSIEIACEKLKEIGARRALVLPVGGAFHSPLMEEAKKELEDTINKTFFSNPICPIYQNVSGLALSTENEIKENLISQLTSPVRWTQSINNMISDGATEFIEVGPGKVLQGLVRKISRDIKASSLNLEND
ncbi:MAG: [acyl-carrier-protein] S-malonyltransferase [Flavobacteriaceae bacterium]|nr:[acyl-carrier-protein] S-malonyltransferase [Flavobacteriaceae bacterium]OUV86324.1 MAG: [acyl-carrier-protein] S-malonyltransferase [Flavobacteriaceae bacterium TMED145]